MRTFFSAAMVLALAAPAAAQAPAPAASNMPPDFYPHPACVKPDKSRLAQPGNDADARRVYNMRVKMFNDKAGRSTLRTTSLQSRRSSMPP